jgi:radical SAM superfamily enzyme YgiQ (UPF0313 family)
VTLTVGLVQFTAELSWVRQRFGGRGRRGTAAPPPTSWTIFPYAAGLLQTYVERHAADPTRFRFAPPVHVREPLDVILARLDGCDVVGFSSYVWNERFSLAVAAAVKARAPRTIVVFGGPQVPDDPTAWLDAHPMVDLTVHGEGEAAFLALVQALADGAPLDGVPSLAFRAAGAIRRTPRAPRITDLDTIPSPYLSGAFDALLAERPHDRWALLWETNRGCPFSCTFCDWGSATASKVHRFAMDRLLAELDWFAERQGEFIFCCDANFGLLPRDLDLARAAAATKARHGGYPRTLSVQNTKNAVERAFEIQRVLSAAGMNGGVTLALQSLDPATLSAIRRDNISAAAFRTLQHRFRAEGIPTYTDIILGLPGESLASYAAGIDALVADGQHDRVQFYNCAMLPNAEMAAPAYRAAHGLQVVPQALIGAHTPVGDRPVTEVMDIVVATGTMPAADWVRAKVLTWAVEILYFDRVLHLPLAVLATRGGVPLSTAVDALLTPAADRPVLSALGARLAERARAVQAGAPEPVALPEALGVWWAVDQWALITLARAFQLEALWLEAAPVLAALASTGLAPVVRDAVALNAALFAQPFEVEDAALAFAHDPWGAYAAALVGAPPPGDRATRGTVVRTRPAWVRWEDWYEHLTFCHNQKAAYLWPWIPAPAEAEVAA